MHLIGAICNNHRELGGVRYAHRNGPKHYPGECVACHKFKSVVAVRNWRHNNLDKLSLQRKRWKQKYPEQVRLYKRMNQKRNKATVNARTKRRKARLIHAVPAWANNDAIKRFYELSLCKTGTTNERWVVDHIVPLNSQSVCGLHVEHNLRVI